MKILIYDSDGKNVEKKYQAGIEMPRSCQVKAADNFQDFDRNIRSCLSGQGVIVFFAKEKRELEYLKSKMTFAGDLKIIISLKDKDLYSDAFSVFPIFVDIWNSEDSDKKILSILNKMVQNSVKLKSAV